MHGLLILSLVLSTVVPAGPATRPGISRGEGTSLVRGDSRLKASDDPAAVAAAPHRARQEAIDRAVADAVHTFLGDYLSPRAFAEAEPKIAGRIEKQPEAFVPDVKILSLAETDGVARAEVEARISAAALRGVLVEIVPPRSILFVLEGTEGGEKLREGSVAARLTAALRAKPADFTIIDPGELELLFEKRPELRRTLGGERGGAELGLRVLAQLVCVGSVSVDADATHLEGVFVGTAQVDLRVIDSASAEVIAAVSLSFRDTIAARRTEAIARARAAIFERVAGALLKEVPPRTGRGLRLSCDLGPIYAALLSGYRSHPFGEIRVKNEGKEEIGPLAVRLSFDEGLLLEPFSVDVPRLAPGAERSIPVVGSLATRLLSIDGEEISARVAVRGAAGDVVEEMRRAVLVHSPNVFSWREPAAIAAYIDADDAAVKDFLAGVWRSLPPGDFPTPELAHAAAIYGGLAARGLRYRRDAAVPQIAMKARALADRVNYPGQTLREGAGDCDDLAVLFAAACEAAGIPSAIIVGPDHVLVAIETGVAPAESAAAIFGSDGVVVRQGRAWWPVEATALARAEPFLGAWRAAWQAGREIAQGEADFVETRSAWETWRPVARPRTEGGSVAPAMPPAAAAAVADSLRAELRRLREFGRERLAEQAEVLRREGGRSSERRAGTLYASFGMIEEARAALTAALGSDDPFAVHYNLGEVLILGPRTERNLKLAIVELRAALAAAPAGDLPSRSDALLRLALACRLSGDAPGEAAALGEAYAIDSGLRREYEALFAASDKGGTLADPIRRFLLKGLK